MVQKLDGKVALAIGSTSGVGLAADRRRLDGPMKTVLLNDGIQAELSVSGRVSAMVL